MSGAIRKLVRIVRWFVRFAREVDRGIAVGRGYAPVGKNVVGRGTRSTLVGVRLVGRGRRAGGFGPIGRGGGNGP